MMKKTYTKILLALSIITICLTAGYHHADAMNIVPPRLVIKADEKIQYMFIKNNSEKEETYRLGWRHMAMDKEGNVLNLDKIGMDKAPERYNKVDDVIRFSPRRATLKPGETQRITFMLRRSSEMPAGEYRSHFLVMREPSRQKKSTEDAAKTDDAEASTPAVSMDVMVSRAVPIYVLNGETNAKINLLSAKVIKNTEKKNASHPDHFVEFKVQKTGNRSVIGQAHIFCKSNGEEIKISPASQTFAVYAEGEFRTEKMAVKLPAAGCSQKRILIKGHPDDVLRGKTLINKTF